MQLKALSPENHQHSRWIPRENFNHLKQQSLVPLILEELSTAIYSMPTAFVRHGEQFIFVGVMGLSPDENLLVGSDGRWLSSYMPADLKTNPFYLVPTTENQIVMCVDESSDAFSSNNVGEAFFNDDGSPTQSVSEIFELLKRTSSGKKIMQQASQIIAKHDLLEPWEIALQTPGGEKRFDGLYKIDEQKLIKLPDTGYLELRDNNAIPLIYGHLYSMRLIQALSDLYCQRRLQETSLNPKSETFDFSSL